MRVVHCQQGTDEWRTARLGRVTASRIADVVARTKSGPSASRANYAAELVCERLTGKPAEKFKSTAMEWGTEQEPAARQMYELMCDATVEQVGLVLHPKCDFAGASPDGLVGLDGQIEIKCPNTSTHIETLLSEQIDAKYLLQIQWQLACTGRQWCDFISFDPRLPAEMQLFVKRIHRDDVEATKLEAAVFEFLSEVESTIEKLRRKFDHAVRAA
jgi:putative phage-type endonuclease